MTLKVDQKDEDYRIERLDNGKFSITDMTTQKTTIHDASDFDLDYGALLRFKHNGNDRLVQYLHCKEDLYFNFYYKGNSLKVTVFDENQFPLKKFMAPPKVIDSAKNIISPMPGAIVSVSVVPG
jgi:hypothetical protein